VAVAATELGVAAVVLAGCLAAVESVSDVAAGSHVSVAAAEPIVLVVFNAKSARYLVLFARKSTR
jgi:ABC-type hemin transport system substrate-binding protein